MKPYVEQDCTVTHEGRQFSAGGAVVTDDYIVAHVGKRSEQVAVAGDMRRDLTDWHGNRIGSCNLASSWPIRSWQSERMFQIYALVNGVTYTGRGMGEGMICRLRRVKTKGNRS